jgi:hypothetical protein
MAVAMPLTLGAAVSVALAFRFGHTNSRGEGGQPHKGRTDTGSIQIQSEFHKSSFPANIKLQGLCLIMKAHPKVM